jgi:hypothetical protein
MTATWVMAEKTKMALAELADLNNQYRPEFHHSKHIGL